MKRLAILLAGIMLAAAGLVIAPATALADDLEIAITTEEAQVYYVDGKFKFDIQVKITNNTGAPIQNFTWFCNGVGSDYTTIETGGTTLTITLQADKGIVGFGFNVSLDVEGAGIDSDGGYGNNYLFASAEGLVTLTPIAITADDVTLSWTETVYSGSSQAPDVKYRDLTLTQDEDYEVTLYYDGEIVESAAEVGDYTLKITGMKAFRGTVEKTFKIKQPPLTVEITTEKVEVYEVGGECFIEVKVTNNTGSDLHGCGVVLFTEGWYKDETAETLSTDETTLYILFPVTQDYVAAGKVSLSASVDAYDAGGSHINSETGPRDIPVILLKYIADCSVTLDPLSIGYNGSPQMPAVTVKDGEATLTSEDYAVVLLRDGQRIERAVDAGDYKVRVEGKGRYYGYVDKTFTINPRTITADMIEVVSPVEYAGSPVTPEVTVKDGEKVLTLGADYKLACINNDGPGTGTVTVTGQGNYTGEVTKTFTINAPEPIYSLSVVFEFDQAATEYQFGDKISGKVTVTNTGTGTVAFVLTCVLCGRQWNYFLVEGDVERFQFTYDVTYDDVLAGMITTAGSVTALGPNDEEIPVTITITDATATVVPTPTVFTIDLGEGTLDGKTGKVAIDANVGQPYPLPTGTPIRKGYTFQFYKGSEYYPGDTYIVEADHTLTAVYKKNQPTIPDTGDAAPIALAIGLLVLSGAGLAFARKRG